MNDTIATAPASAPTLVELIDELFLNNNKGNEDAPESEIDRLIGAVRESAVKLETERALLRAEIGERIEEQGDLESELKGLKRLYALEEKDADSYARRMHLAQNVAAYLYSIVEIPILVEELSEDDLDVIKTVAMASLTKGSRPFVQPTPAMPSRTLPTSLVAQVSPIVEL